MAQPGTAQNLFFLKRKSFKRNFGAPSVKDRLAKENLYEKKNKRCVGLEELFF